MLETLEQLYREIASNGADAGAAKTVLKNQGWFASTAEFDPVTDEPLATTLDELLARIRNVNGGVSLMLRDRLGKICAFVSGAALHIISEIHEKNVREHYVSHYTTVRQIDSTCIRAVAKKPGRTLKQKIASDQKMMGVHHNTSADTAENRLFKAFLQRLDDLLFQKERALKELGAKFDGETAQFSLRIHRWLQGEESGAIGAWRNLLPNNTLLQDRNYRKVWKAWNALQRIDEETERDARNAEAVSTRIGFFKSLAGIASLESVRLRQKPIFIDCAELKIFSDRESKKFLADGFWKRNGSFEELKLTVNPLPVQEIASESARQTQTAGQKAESGKTADRRDFCAVDLSSVQPAFAVSRSEGRRLDGKLLYQNWDGNDVPCFNSKCIDSKKPTASIRSIFSGSEGEEESVAGRAGKLFAKRLAAELNCSECAYIIPDATDDFSPVQKSFRRSMNAAFTRAGPIPRSIAAAFGWISENGWQSLSDGDEFHVLDRQDERWILTRVRVRLDKKQNRPYCEHHPARLVPNDDKVRQCSYENGFPASMRGIFGREDIALLRGRFTAGSFHLENPDCISVPDYGEDAGKIGTVLGSKVSGKTIRIETNASDDLSRGAAFLHEEQEKTPEFRLWREYLPELKMRALINGKESDFVLVGKEGNSVSPIPGQAVRIPIQNRFVLPAGATFYEFPLVQGSGTQRQKYFAFIANRRLPLSRDHECELLLTYTYGAEIPYSLTFRPVRADAEFASLSVTWENKSHRDLRKLPFPNFCKEYAWEDMRDFPKRDSGDSDLIDWLGKECEKLKTAKSYSVLKKLPARFGQEDDTVFLNHVCENGQNPICYVPAERNVQVGDPIWCNLKRTAKGYQGELPIDEHGKCRLTASLRFPTLTIWNNGRSLGNADAPVELNAFIGDMEREALRIVYSEDTPNEVKNEMYFFFCYLHEDMPEEISEELIPLLLKSEHFAADSEAGLYFKPLGFAIGKCSKAWQEKAFRKIIEFTGERSMRRFAFQSLAIALWREKSVVFRLTQSETDSLVTAALEELKVILGKKKATYFDRSVLASILEVTLAIMRLRENAEDPLLELLSPYCNKRMQDLRDSIADVKKKNIPMKSFLEFANGKSLPDAAFSFISGNEDSKSIRVIGASFE